MRLASVSVDLDEVPCYLAIYGLRRDVVAEEVQHAIYDKAVPRFASLCDELDVRATFFAIGTDVARNAARLRALYEAGHEIGNHSWSHRYDMTRLDEAAIVEEVGRGVDAITSAVGVRPVGFRAPGYTITDAVFEALHENGVRYDSSVWPCPAYFAAKALAIGAIGARGRKSRSIVGDPRVLLAPSDPYRIGTPYFRAGTGMIELPIGVTRGARLPYYGTSVVLAGENGARWLTRAMIGRPHVNLELHGIDLADADADGLRVLAAHQVDVRISVERKRAALRSAITTLRDAGYRFVTLAQAAEAFG